MTKWIIYAQDYGQPAPGDWYDAVTDAGLDNTGSQSVTSGIVSAIEDYKALGKDGLYFPPGTYLLSTALTVPNDSVLLGTKNTGPDACTAHLAGQVVCGSRSSFTDLKIGPETAGLAGLRNVDGADDTSFTRCHFRGGGAASDEYNSPTCCLGGGRALSNAVFTDCEFERSLGDNWTGPGDNTHIDNVIRIDARSGKRIDTVTFDGCHFGVSNGVATGSKRMGIEVWSGHGATDQFRNMTFRSCVFEATNNCQLDFSCYGDSLQAENILVEGCTFKGGGVGMTSAGWGYAICLEWPKNVVIKNNTFYRCSETAINTNNYTQPYDGNWKITGNTFDFDTAYEGITARMGIIVMQGANSTITGNTFNWHGSFSGWASNGCILFAHSDATGNTVTGNTFNVSQTQNVGNNWDGATDNGEPWTGTNTINRS